MNIPHSKFFIYSIKMADENIFYMSIKKFYSSIYRKGEHANLKGLSLQSATTTKLKSIEEFLQQMIIYWNTTKTLKNPRKASQKSYDKLQIEGRVLNIVNARV